MATEVWLQLAFRPFKPGRGHQVSMVFYFCFMGFLNLFALFSIPFGPILESVLESVFLWLRVTRRDPATSTKSVPTLTGHLRAFWPDLWECTFEVWPAQGAREGLQKVGGDTSHMFEGLPGPLGPARFQKHNKKLPVCLCGMSGTREPAGKPDFRPCCIHVQFTLVLPGWRSALRARFRLDSSACSGGGTNRGRADRDGKIQDLGGLGGPGLPGNL
jgi:hypothetical protein